MVADNDPVLAGVQSISPGSCGNSPEKAGFRANEGIQRVFFRLYQSWVSFNGSILHLLKRYRNFGDQIFFWLLWAEQICSTGKNLVSVLIIFVYFALRSGQNKLPASIKISVLPFHFICMRNS
jgi:hypothetical protein